MFLFQIPNIFIWWVEGVVDGVVAGEEVEEEEGNIVVPVDQ